MEYRSFGRCGWSVSEVGHGTWGMGRGESGWSGGSDAESLEALRESVSLGCNFIDTAWIYGRGNSERLVGQILSEFRHEKIYVASKIPPMNMEWPASVGVELDQVFPEEHVNEYVNRTLENLNVDSIDLMMFHVWQDSWADNDDWKQVVQQLVASGKVKSFGISVNTWEPSNVIDTLKTGLISSVEVIYNIFEQQPEDCLLPFCRENDVAVIARVPFDEGTLTGNITLDSKWENGDWRNSYFVEENLVESVPRVDQLRSDKPDGMSMAELALRFILSNPDVSTVIPGMRKLQHVRNNIKASDGRGLANSLLLKMKSHRWDRKPTWWSQ